MFNFFRDVFDKCKGIFNFFKSHIINISNWCINKLSTAGNWFLTTRIANGFFSFLNKFSFFGYGTKAYDWFTKKKSDINRKKQQESQAKKHAKGVDIIREARRKKIKFDVFANNDKYIVKSFDPKKDPTQEREKFSLLEKKIGVITLDKNIIANFDKHVKSISFQEIEQFEKVINGSEAVKDILDVKKLLGLDKVVNGTDVNAKLLLLSNEAHDKIKNDNLLSLIHNVSVARVEGLKVSFDFIPDVAESFLLPSEILQQFARYSLYLKNKLEVCESLQSYTDLEDKSLAKKLRDYHAHVNDKLSELNSFFDEKVKEIKVKGLYKIKDTDDKHIVAVKRYFAIENSGYFVVEGLNKLSQDELKFFLKETFNKSKVKEVLKNRFPGEFENDAVKGIFFPIINEQNKGVIEKIKDALNGGYYEYKKVGFYNALTDKIEVRDHEEIIKKQEKLNIYLNPVSPNYLSQTKKLFELSDCGEELSQDNLSLSTKLFLFQNLKDVSFNYESEDIESILNKNKEKVEGIKKELENIEEEDKEKIKSDKGKLKEYITKIKDAKNKILKLKEEEVSNKESYEEIVNIINDTLNFLGKENFFGNINEELRIEGNVDKVFALIKEELDKGIDSDNPKIVALKDEMEQIKKKSEESIEELKIEEYIKEIEELNERIKPLQEEYNWYKKSFWSKSKGDKVKVATRAFWSYIPGLGTYLAETGEDVAFKIKLNLDDLYDKQQEILRGFRNSLRTKNYEHVIKQVVLPIREGRPDAIKYLNDVKAKLSESIYSVEDKLKNKLERALCCEETLNKLNERNNKFLEERLSAANQVFDVDVSDKLMDFINNVKEISLEEFSLEELKEKLLTFMEGFELAEHEKIVKDLVLTKKDKRLQAEKCKRISGILMNSFFDNVCKKLSGDKKEIVEFYRKKIIKQVYKEVEELNPQDYNKVVELILSKLENLFSLVGECHGILDEKDLKNNLDILKISIRLLKDDFKERIKKHSSQAEEGNILNRALQNAFQRQWILGAQLSLDGKFLEKFEFYKNNYIEESKNLKYLYSQVGKDNQIWTDILVRANNAIGIVRQKTENELSAFIGMAKDRGSELKKIIDIAESFSSILDKIDGNDKDSIENFISLKSLFKSISDNRSVLDEPNDNSSEYCQKQLILLTKAMQVISIVKSKLSSEKVTELEEKLGGLNFSEDTFKRLVNLRNIMEIVIEPSNWAGLGLQHADVSKIKKDDFSCSDISLKDETFVHLNRSLSEFAKHFGKNSKYDSLIANSFQDALSKVSGGCVVSDVIGDLFWEMFIKKKINNGKGVFGYLDEKYLKHVEGGKAVLSQIEEIFKSEVKNIFLESKRKNKGDNLLNDKNILNSLNNVIREMCRDEKNKRFNDFIIDKALNFAKIAVECTTSLSQYSEFTNVWDSFERLVSGKGVENVDPLELINNPCLKSSSFYRAIFLSSLKCQKTLIEEILTPMVTKTKSSSTSTIERAELMTCSEIDKAYKVKGSMVDALLKGSSLNGVVKRLSEGLSGYDSVSEIISSLLSNTKSFLTGEKSLQSDNSFKGPKPVLSYELFIHDLKYGSIANKSKQKENKHDAFKGYKPDKVNISQYLQHDGVQIEVVYVKKFDSKNHKEFIETYCKTLGDAYGKSFVILTDDNKAYFVKDGKLLEGEQQIDDRGTLPKTIDKIEEIPDEPQQGKIKYENYLESAALVDDKQKKNVSDLCEKARLKDLCKTEDAKNGLKLFHKYLDGLEKAKAKIPSLIGIKIQKKSEQDFDNVFIFDENKRTVVSHVRVTGTDSKGESNNFSEEIREGFFRSLINYYKKYETLPDEVVINSLIGHGNNAHWTSGIARFPVIKSKFLLDGVAKVCAEIESGVRDENSATLNLMDTYCSAFSFDKFVGKSKFLHLDSLGKGQTYFNRAFSKEVIGSFNNLNMKVENVQPKGFVQSGSTCFDYSAFSMMLFGTLGCKVSDDVNIPNSYNLRALTTNECASDIISRMICGVKENLFKGNSLENINASNKRKINNFNDFLLLKAKVDALKDKLTEEQKRCAEEFLKGSKKSNHLSIKKLISLVDKITGEANSSDDAKEIFRYIKNFAASSFSKNAKILELQRKVKNCVALKGDYDSRRKYWLPFEKVKHACFKKGVFDKEEFSEFKELFDSDAPIDFTPKNIEKFHLLVNKVSALGTQDANNLLVKLRFISEVQKNDVLKDKIGIQPLLGQYKAYCQKKQKHLIEPLKLKV